MKLFLLFAIAFPHVLGQDPPVPKGTFIIHTLVDQTVITVHENRSVSTEIYQNLPTQHWTIVEHPNDPEQVEFKNDVVPYNHLSGAGPNEIPGNPNPEPKRFTLKYFADVDNAPYFQILIWKRWCMIGLGAGRLLDRLDCYDDQWPSELWRFEEVA